MRGLMIAAARSADCSADNWPAEMPKYLERRGCRTPDAVAPFDQIQIQLENARLRQFRFEPARDEQLTQLAGRIS